MQKSVLKELIKQRRIIELILYGNNLIQIAEILKFEASTVTHDYSSLRENAIKVLQKYLAETALVQNGNIILYIR
ncbi:MAG: hypothetical protein M3275_07810 [Thermoproteota archaeon]|nr:hypothetical protein [Thermoproteota archaeon]